MESLVHILLFSVSQMEYVGCGANGHLLPLQYTTKPIECHYGITVHMTTLYNTEKSEMHAHGWR